MLNALLRKRPKSGAAGQKVGDALYAAVSAQARQPAFYTTLGVADRIDARFELYTLHALLLILRLRDEDADGAGEGATAAQSLFDVYVSALDNVLRELGVGDISMARKMRTLGEALYGRMTAYEPAVRTGDAETLALHLARNVYVSEDATQAGPLARYALAARASLAAQAFPDVLTAPSWPEISA
ncbi:ubiquinol-cytochrome C chaperone family protein [soil metagenome]